MPDRSGDFNFPHTSLLGQLSPKGQRALASKWRIEKHDAKHLIFGAKDPDRDVFFVLEGSVRAAAYTMDGKEISFNVIQQGDCFGEIAAIDGGVRSSGVVSIEEITIARLTPAEFQIVLDTNSEVSRAFLHLMCGKIRGMSDRLLSYTELTTPQRVRKELAHLGRMARKQARANSDSVVITDMPTQEEIGKRILARREAVAREVGNLKRAGLLEKHPDGLFIPSIRRLEAEILL